MRKIVKKTVAADIAADTDAGWHGEVTNSEGRKVEVFVPRRDEDIEAAEKAAKGALAKAAKAAKKKPAKAAPKAAKISKRAELLAQCEAGQLPAAPDFSANTHARFRKRLAEIVALVEAGNVKGLKAMRDSINPVSTSPRAMVRYASLAIIAIEAANKAAKAASKAAA